MNIHSAGLVYLGIFILQSLHFSFIQAKSRKLTKERFMQQRQSHSMKALSQRAAKRATISTDYETFHRNYLQYILRVRVPGTVGHHEVKMFLINKLKEFGWVVQLDEFVDDTPIKKIKFTNIMATLNPKANRRLALAAHYDSKLLEPKNGKYFIAATDSAVPVAMLLDLAKLLGDAYKKNPNALGEVTPMILLLDGEEAFVDWTETDSIYGARHLSDVMENTPHNNKVLRSQGVSLLESISAFVLFDLIGEGSTQFMDLFPSSTSLLYNTMVQTEEKLRREGKLQRMKKYFVGKPVEPLYVEDDHLPFLKKGVPILHLISIPFPKCWHKLDDDESALDKVVITDLLILFRRFFCEYFALEPGSSRSL